MDRDQEIRRLAHIVMRASGCTREVAIEFLCSIGEEERKVIRKMKILATLNRPRPKPRQRSRSLAARLQDRLEAWSQPR
jgi:hypothetical protein